MEILTRHILQMEILTTYLTNGNTYDVSYKWKYLRHILPMEILTTYLTNGNTFTTYLTNETMPNY